MSRQTPGKAVGDAAAVRIVVTKSPEGTARFAEDARGNLHFVSFTPARKVES
jgi:hypothetical protein